jgi:serine/threonine protein kinase
MIAITRDNFLPFKKIPENTDTNNLDIVLYPRIFSGEIDQKVTELLRNLEYDRVSYCVDNKIAKKAEKALWLMDKIGESEVKYVFSTDQIHGITSRETPTFVKCLQYGIGALLATSYNSCMIRVQDDEESTWINDHKNWKESNENIALVFFGTNTKLIFKHRETGSKKLVMLESGTMLVLRKNFIRNWVYKVKNVKGNISYRMIFSYITDSILSNIPKAMEICEEDKNNLESIYLSNSERINLIEGIRDTVKSVAKVHGENCVNGTKADLLKKLELKKLLGRGSYGNVYSACAPVPCDDDSYQFAVKLAIIDKISFKTPFVTNRKMWHEAYILRYIINPLLHEGICPNLPMTADMFTCADCKFILPVADKGMKKKIGEKTSPCLIILTELATGGDMVNWFNSNPADTEDYYTALFQIMAGLHTLQTHAQILNNDIKAANILTYNVRPGGYWKYIVHGKEFYVPNRGKLFIINDFGVSLSYDTKHKLASQKTSKWCPLGQRYAMIVDGKYSPLEARKNNSILGQEIPPTKLNWGFMSSKRKTHLGKRKPGWESKAISNGSQAFISYKLDKINDPDIAFTEEQEKILRDMSIPADSSNTEFYQHPKVIPPFELRYDTQDAIRIFTGGKRSTQPMFHKVFDTIPKEITDNLKPYLTESFQYNFIDNYPSKHFAGYFIEEFFTRVHDYTGKPKDEEVIAEFKISS